MKEDRIDRNNLGFRGAVRGRGRREGGARGGGENDPLDVGGIWSCVTQLSTRHGFFERLCKLVADALLSANVAAAKGFSAIVRRIYKDATAEIRNRLEFT